MKAIVQEHPMSCGVACVAFVAGVSYKRALRKLNSKYASTRGYYCKNLVKGLSKFGLKYSFGKYGVKTKRYLNVDGTIVFIRHPVDHYLVRTKKGWMNSWINYPCIIPAKAGFNKKLPGKAEWVIFKIEDFK
jgi:hypothetical protein